MRVGIAVVDGAFTSGVASVLDVLRTAEMLRGQVDPAIPAIEVSVHASRRSVRTAGGLMVAADSTLADLPGVDVVLVAGFGQFDAASVFDQLRAPHSLTLIRHLSALGDDHQVAAACTGTFALAEAGLLEHRRATTSWWLSSAFRSRYPTSRLDMAAMVVHDGRATTAGAAFGHVDLTLDLLRGVSVSLADLVASFLLIDHRPSQSSYAALAHLAAQDELVAAFERHVRGHLASDTDVDHIAGAIGASRRTLERRVRAALGTSPLQVIQRIRVERARHLMATTDRSADDIARSVGYLNASTLQTLMRRQPARTD